ncbi:Ku70 Ku80 N terminal alpha beta domain [Trypanosoma vivax]|nr:KU70 protein [Trypanosoma vivax]KAH8607225.1 Ku70 Ku80 N terminal alpha beta domain [Trypanosoma vivax]
MAYYHEWASAVDGTLSLDEDDNDSDNDNSGDLGHDGYTPHVTEYSVEQDAVLCLVDCQSSMFRVGAASTGERGPSGATDCAPWGDQNIFRIETPGGGSHSSTAFGCTARCVQQLYRDKGISNYGDKVAVVLYNTSESSEFALPGVYVLLPFRSFDIKSMLVLEELAAAGTIPSSAYDTFSHKVGHALDCQCHVSDALRTAESMFVALQHDMIKHCRIFIFTNDEKPHRGSMTELEECVRQVQSLNKIGVHIVVYGIGHCVRAVRAVTKGSVVSSNDKSDSGIADCAVNSVSGDSVRGRKHGDDIVHGCETSSCCDGFWRFLRDAVSDDPQTFSWKSLDIVCTDNSNSTFEALCLAVRWRTHPCRPYQNTSLTIGVPINGASVPKLAVSVYHPLASARFQGAKWLDNRANEVVMLQQRADVVGSLPASLHVGEDSGLRNADQTPVRPHQQPHSCFSMGAGPGCVIASQERKHIISITTAGAPIGFSILCFKRTEDVLQHKYAIGRSCLLHPNPQDGSDGSLRLFVHLTRVLIQQQKVAVAQYVARRGVPPRLVALVPSPSFSSLGQGCYTNCDRSNVCVAVNAPVQGVGLYVVPLPYADDIRPTPQLPCFTSETEPTPQDVELAKQMLSVLTTPFDISAVPNPALELRCKFIQDVVRSREKCFVAANTLGEKTEDSLAKTKVRDCTLFRRVDWTMHAEIFHEFKTKTLCPSYSAHSLCATARQLRLNEGTLRSTRCGDGTDNKDNSEDIVKVIRKAFDHNALSALTVAQLKEYLRVAGVEVAGSTRKVQLLQVVTERLQKEK